MSWPMAAMLYNAAHGPPKETAELDMKIWIS